MFAAAKIGNGLSEFQGCFMSIVGVEKIISKKNQKALWE